MIFLSVFAFHHMMFSQCKKAIGSGFVGQIQKVLVLQNTFNLESLAL